MNFFKLYLCKENNIKTTSTRQRYLTSESKQEHLITYTDLEVIFEFKSINKELVIELSNELMDSKRLEVNSSGLVLTRDINNIKHHTSYNRFAGAIHLNENKYMIMAIKTIKALVGKFK